MEKHLVLRICSIGTTPSRLAPKGVHTCVCPAYKKRIGTDWGAPGVAIHIVSCYLRETNAAAVACVLNARRFCDRDGHHTLELSPPLQWAAPQGKHRRGKKMPQKSPGDFQLICFHPFCFYFFLFSLWPRPAPLVSPSAFAIAIGLCDRHQPVRSPSAFGGLPFAAGACLWRWSQ